MSEDTKEMALEAFRHEMKAGQIISDLFLKNDREDGEEALIEAFKEIIDNADSEKRAEQAAKIMQTFGQQLQSESIMRATVEIAEGSDLLEVADGEG